MHAPACMQAPAAAAPKKDAIVPNSVPNHEVEHIPAPAPAAPDARAFPLAQPALALPTGPVAIFKETFAPFTLAGVQAGLAAADRTCMLAYLTMWDWLWDLLPVRHDA